jgi:hypothetical protein
MKKLIIWTVAIAAIFLCASAVLAKEAAEKDIKINPKVDFSKLEWTTITIYKFENAAGEGQDIQDALINECIDMMGKNGIQAALLKDTKIGEEKDEFALSMMNSKGDNTELYSSSPTDLVLSGKLIRLDSHEKQTWGGYKNTKYWTASIEVFIFSKSLNTIVYKANVTRIFEQKGSFGKVGSKARSTVFRSCLEDAFEPFFQKVIHPEVKDAEEVIKAQ